jgi:hypothetical protein
VSKRFARKGHYFASGIVTGVGTIECQIDPRQNLARALERLEKHVADVGLEPAHPVEK